MAEVLIQPGKTKVFGMKRTLMWYQKMRSLVLHWFQRSTRHNIYTYMFCCTMRSGQLTCWTHLAVEPGPVKTSHAVHSGTFMYPGVSFIRKPLTNFWEEGTSNTYVLFGESLEERKYPWQVIGPEKLDRVAQTFYILPAWATALVCNSLSIEKALCRILPC